MPLKNHISSSDSCSRSVFFRSPTSEEQNLLSRDLTNLRRVKGISCYVKAQSNVYTTNSKLSVQMGEATLPKNHFYLAFELPENFLWIKAVYK